MLEFSISGQILRKKYIPKIVGDSQGYLYAKFHFSKDWDGVVKTAFFKKNGEGEPIRQFIKDGVCLVPWEVLVGDGFFTVACYGTNQPEQANKFITTNEIQVDINESAFPQGIDPTNPTEGLWGQGLAIALQQIREETAKVVGEVTKAGNDAKVDALGAIELAKTGALEAIATDKQSAVDAIKLAETTALGNIGKIDTTVANALKDIEDKRVTTIAEVTQLKDGAVAAVNDAESLAITNIGNHKDEAIGAIATGKLEATEAIAVDKVEALKAINDESIGVLQQMSTFNTVAQEAITSVATKGDEKVALIRSESKTGLDTITKAKYGAVNEITTLTTNSVNIINENKQGSVDLVNKIATDGITKINKVGQDAIDKITPSVGEAKLAAESAKVSAGNAKASETNASASAVSAKTEADRAKQEADRATGMLDDTVISKDKTWSSQNIADHIGCEVSGSGAVVQLDNLMGGYPLEVVSRSEQPVSEMTLYVGGKNSISYPYYDGEKKVKNGITFVVNKDGTITANGTATAIADFVLSATQFVKKGMKFFGTPHGASLQTFELQIYGNNDNFISSINNDSAKRDFTGIARCRIRQGVTVKDLVFKPYLTFDDSFEQYQKGEIKRHTATFPTPVTEHTWQGVTSVDGDNVIFSSADSVTVKGHSKNIIDDNAVAKDKVQSSKAIYDSICLPFKEKASVVQCFPVKDYPLAVVSEITPHQEGEGEPSPSNVRNFIKFNSCYLQQSGKNLLPASNNVSVHYYKPFNIALPAGTYVLSYRNYKTDAQTEFTFLIGIVLRDSAKSEMWFAINKKEKKSKFTINEPAVRIEVYSNTSSEKNITVIFEDLQLEKDDVATPYEPYRGTTYSQSLVGLNGKYGLVNWNTGRMLVTMDSSTFDGSVDEDWYIHDYKNIHSFAILTKNRIINNDSQKSNRYKYRPYAWAGKELNTFTVDNPTGVYPSYAYFKSPNESVTTVEQWRAWLKDNPITIVYELATPYEIQLSPTDIRAIAGLNQLYSNTGDTQVEGRENPIYTITQLQKALTELGGKENV